MSYAIPKGFYVTADERRVAERVHEEIPGGTRYTPPNYAELERLVERLKRYRANAEADGKCAEAEGEQWKADQARADIAEIDYVLNTWRARWKAFGGEKPKGGRS